MGAETVSGRERFFSLLPFYANGTLSETERAWMQEFASGDDELQRSLAIESTFAGFIRHSIESQVPSLSTDAALVRARSVWHQRRRQNAWWFPFVNLPKLVIAAMSALAAVSVAQWVYIGVIFTGVAYAPSRSISPDCRMEPIVRFTLRPDARWEDVVLLLRSQGLLVRQGPNETGQISLAVPVGKTAEAVVSAVTADVLVQLVEVMPPSKSPECQPR